MRVFVSYTRRDESVTLEKLSLLNNILESYCRPFIHIIHGDSARLQQINVIWNLVRANTLLLVRSPENHLSSWVQLELSIARWLRIPIKEIDIDKLALITQNIFD